VVDLLPFLSSSLGLQGLACLAACSKQCKGECLDLAKASGIELLLNELPPRNATGDLAVTAAAAAEAALQVPAQAGADRHLKSVLWLLQVARAVTSSALDDAAVLHRLLMLPAVPLATAQQVVAAGVRISYAQLLAAANSMAAGVEVWVQAQHSLGIATDLPAAAVAICCGQDWVSGSRCDPGMQPQPNEMKRCSVLRITFKHQGLVQMSSDHQPSTSIAALLLLL
jgi:hypothetical protein